ncbi:type II toxin-antitoxin system RelE/ParE family toxin [Aquirufa ecclesiirivi]|uniref:type II toxin-antitoxin system RelE/ParE family toxin n=1 Tax=Aquirufa ecclesiirivi TaxID=2715124 RepID=UPI00140C7326|nr:type II toxin-antitoxin system RelE/ParE family toxin [Aquirufa ecclesiirivi]NHC50084.1 type II toxin-antitoxin system RelE/ParE family toxin [Aquirufa ecclesiirivi]
MKSGYRIVWTNHALTELQNTIHYLEENWTGKELQNLATNIEEAISLISHNPYLFQVSEIKRNIRRVTIAKHNTLYYRLKEDQIEILSFFSHRQSPEKRKLGTTS